MIINRLSFDSGLLLGQNKTSKDVTLGSENMCRTFFFSIFSDILSTKTTNLENSVDEQFMKIIVTCSPN